MGNDARRYLFVAFFVALTSCFCLGEEKTVDSESLLAQARKSDVWSNGTPAVKVRTEIEIVDAQGKIRPGQYFVIWISPSRWREELEIGNYKRLRVHDGKGYWQQSPISFQPEIIFQLESMLDLRAALKIGPKQELGKVKTRDKDGVREKCVEVKWAKGTTERILCFDEANGSLLSVEYSKGQSPMGPDISRVEYGAFNKLSDKRIPYEVHAFHDRKVIITTRITEVTPITEADPGLFAPLANSEFWPQCDDMQVGEVVKRVQPNYPATAREHRDQGRVGFYAVIQVDGSLSNLTLIRGATPELEAAATDALRQWRYKPATCGSTPIRVETSISFDFWIP